MEFNKLIEKTKQWSIERNLHTANPLKQFQKLNEEFGELNSGIAKDKIDIIEDSIGDCLVVLTILAQQLNIEDIEQLLNYTNSNPDYYTKNMALTESLVLYGSRNIGEIAKTMLDMIYNPGALNNIAKMKIAIGSVAAVIDKIAINYDQDTRACFEVAYNIIKDRRGKMIDGVWVKEADL
ncbi:MazG-like family protein [Streptococcus parauberis]|uniref:DNA binding protein n=1 Tax=Streptococcus parauberis KRS-02083 TaxID=1207545 RepID=A0ABP2SW15_9STRE|nr:MazG-like family protein [Streptococcus parauberis]EMG24678.1 putative DNA binding protein [Streptococcus parauberis KRS-02083]QBX27548.1 DNA-binding protein [Streptococcus phage Javan394]WEM65253.1 MazG-like family protein [Streptococcus parauberis]WOF47119.1 MazG-like family protein [Streptococcus parauberis]